MGWNRLSQAPEVDKQANQSNAQDSSDRPGKSAAPGLTTPRFALHPPVRVCALPLITEEGAEGWCSFCPGERCFNRNPRFADGLQAQLCVFMQTSAKKIADPLRRIRGQSDQSGSFVTTAASTSVVVSPSNALFPLNISYSTHPKAQMSARRSTAFPFACSGLMYAAVPRITPACVAATPMVGELAR